MDMAIEYYCTYFERWQIIAIESEEHADERMKSVSERIERYYGYPHDVRKRPLAEWDAEYGHAPKASG